MALNLEKQAEKVGLVLTKRGINDIPCQVKLAIDRSGSMDGLYYDGTVQQVVERILAIGMKVDKDKSIDVWAFHHDSLPANPATVPFIEGYVRREIEKFSSGATNYGPVMEDIVKAQQQKTGFLGKLFGKPKPVEASPTFVVFVTDGENSDEHEAEQVIKSSQDQNIYWQLVGIGHANFRFIERMGDKYPNCGFVAIDDIADISEDKLYEKLINDEFAAWVKKFA